MPTTRLALLAAVVGCGFGCGYRLMQPGAPFGLTTIAVEPFAEEKPVGISPDLCRALSAHLAADGVTLLTDRSRAQGILRGVILNASTRSSPTNAGSSARIPAYLVSIQIQASLLNHSGETVWEATISVNEDFLAPNLVDPLTQIPTAADPNLPLATEAERRKALRRLVDRAAREIHDRLVMASALRPDSET